MSRLRAPVGLLLLLAACGDKDDEVELIYASGEDPGEDGGGDSGSGTGGTDDDCIESPEICNGEDDDCDGLVDDEDPDLELGTTTAWYPDADGDGYGAGEAVAACEEPEGSYSLTEDDCDDTDPSTFPGAPELCTEVDSNCDGDTDDSGHVGFVGTDGQTVDYTEDFAGGATEPVYLTLEESGTLYFCEGEDYYASIALKADIDVVGVGQDEVIIHGVPDVEKAIFTVVEPGTTETLHFSGLTLRDSLEQAIRIDDADVDLFELTFARNDAHDYGYDTRGYGGAVYMRSGELTAQDCTFEENYSYYDGGALMLDGGAHATITGSHFEGNESDAGGAIMVTEYSSLLVEDSTFAANMVKGGGGHIKGSTAELEVRNSTFTDGYGSDGAAIVAQNNSTLLVDGCTFTDNLATYSVSGDQNGGAVYIGSSEATITGSTFDGNRSKDSGGALYLNSAEAAVDDCTFTDNASNTGSGGAIHLTESELTVLGSTFEDNSADDWGGGLSLNDSQASIQECAFADNIGDRCGGDLRLHAATTYYGFDVIDSDFGASYPDTACMTAPSTDVSYEFVGEDQSFSCYGSACE